MWTNLTKLLLNLFIHFIVYDIIMFIIILLHKLFIQQ